MGTYRELVVEDLRTKRNVKLTQSDVDLLRAIEDASSYANYNIAKSAWVTYRQALRDYPASIPSPLADDLSDLPPMPLSPPEQAALEGK